MTVKRYAFAATLSLLLGVLPYGGAQAAAIDLNLSQPVLASGAGEPSAASRIDPAAMPVTMSELPEPEVFAMMVVGVILIGYRVSRDSSEKFK
jgi:hypothetical protein